MTLKDKLPDRLKCSPLLTMESDSDIETIAESIVNLSDSDGDFFKKTEKLLLMACLGYLRDWCEPSQRTIGNLISLLDAALPKDNETHTTLDNLFYEMKSGCKRVKSEDGITTLWEPSALSRCDGLTPRDSNGIDVSEDFSLTCYEGFRHAATRETRTSIVTTLLLVLEEVEKEDADAPWRFSALLTNDHAAPIAFAASVTLSNRSSVSKQIIALFLPILFARLSKETVFSVLVFLSCDFSFLQKLLPRPPCANARLDCFVGKPDASIRARFDTEPVL